MFTEQETFWQHINEFRLINAMGYRSPPFAVPMSGGSTSPGQGRSIREHDEQLNALRKENFNLKLRIYFMEEKTSSSNLPESSESLFKENVDLKVQAEALRVELKEKQNLLCEAATALELMEQSQKSREEACQSTIEELNRKIEFLEMEIHSMEKHQDNTSIGDYLGRSIVECDFKSSARESNVKCIESTEQMIQTEKLLREKECEVELWEEKYNKLKEEYSTLKNDNEKSFEKCPAEHGTALSAHKFTATLTKLNKSNHSNDIRLKIISEQSRLLQQLHNENVNKQKIIDDSKKQLAVYEGHMSITERHNKHLFDENKMLKDFMYELEQHKIRSKARKMQEQLLKSKHNSHSSWSCSIN